LFFSKDCISIDDNNHRNSSNLSLNTDVPNCSQDNIIPINTCCSNNNTSTDNIDQRSGSISSQSSRTRGNYQYFNHKSFHSPFLNSDCKTNKELERSQSLDSLSFPPLREKTTNDSGTGGSVTNFPSETSAEPLHYDIVPVFGQTMLVLMAKRYEFDPAKVAEYKNRKRPIIGPLFGKPARPVPEATPKSRKRGLPASKKPSHSILHFLNPFKSSTNNQTTSKPLVRHHSSHHLPDGNA